MLPGFCWQVLNKRHPAPAAKLKLNKEILIQAQTAVPGLESAGEDTKKTKSNLDDKPDQLKVLKNMELVNELRTMSRAAALISAPGCWGMWGHSTYSTTLNGGHRDSG